jgi:hypothetical protein
LLAASNITVTKLLFRHFCSNDSSKFGFCAKSKLMLNNNKKRWFFMLFGFVISKCIEMQGQKIIYTILVFYYMKPEKRTFIVWLKKPVRTEKGVHQKNNK